MKSSQLSLREKLSYDYILNNSSIYNNFIDPVFILNSCLKVVYCNNSFISFSGLKPQSNALRSYEDYFQIKEDKSLLKKHLSSQKLKTDAKMIKGQNSKNKPLLFNLRTQPLYTSGKPSGLLINIQDLSHELQKNEKHIKMILESSLDAIIIIDHNGKIQEWNKQAEEIFGWNVIEIKNRSLSESIIPSVHREAHNRGIERYFRTGKSELLGKHIELTALKKNGKKIDVELTISPILYKGGNGCCGFLRDITNRKQQEKKLKQEKIKAEEGTKTKSEFLAIMSHEIRTPMNGVLGMSELLSETSLTEEQRDYLDNILSSSEALLTIINDILDYSKIEAGKLDFEMVEFDVRDLIQKVLRIFTFKLGNKDIKFKFYLDPKIKLKIRSDPGRFRQILINFLGNAIKFTEKGSISVKIILEEELKTSYKLKVIVADTGIGIAEDKLEKLFDSFTQADLSTTRKYGGTGLGLAICKKLVEIMKGDIGIESKLGEGSTFWFSGKFEKGSSVETRNYTLTSIKNKRIMLISSNSDTQTIFANYLNSFGCQMITISSAKIGLLKIEKMNNNGEQLDLVISDLIMLEMNGMEFGNAVRKIISSKKLPMILFSSRGFRGDASKAQKNGFQGYLSKPITQSQIHNCTMEILKADPSKRANEIITKHNSENVTANLKILLVEDNLINQKVASTIINKMGYEYDIANNGLVAVKMTSQTQYDLILMDMQMPKMDGITATKMIRKKGTTNTPIIACTANAMDDDKKKCLHAGMNDFISKPIKIKSLRSIISKWNKKE